MIDFGLGALQDGIVFHTTALDRERKGEILNAIPSAVARPGGGGSLGRTLSSRPYPALHEIDVVEF